MFRVTTSEDKIQMKSKNSTRTCVIILTIHLLVDEFLPRISKSRLEH